MKKAEFEALMERVLRLEEFEQEWMLKDGRMSSVRVVKNVHGRYVFEARLSRFTHKKDMGPRWENTWVDLMVYDGGTWFCYDVAGMSRICAVTQVGFAVYRKIFSYLRTIPGIHFLRCEAGNHYCGEPILKIYTDGFAGYLLRDGE